jgi:hypothetical protein
MYIYIKKWCKLKIHQKLIMQEDGEKNKRFS